MAAIIAGAVRLSRSLLPCRSDGQSGALDHGPHRAIEEQDAFGEQFVEHRSQTKKPVQLFSGRAR